MLTKTNFIFLVTLISICLLFACQKDPITTTPTIMPSIYAHMEGDFYTQRVYSTGYAYNSLNYSYYDTADTHIEVSLRNDTLRVLDYVFVIDSVNQTSFSASITNPYNPEVLRLDYSNNYNSIVFYHERFSTTAGANPRSRINYSGIRSSRDKKRSSAGLYTLKVRHKQFSNQIDTQYTADLNVDVFSSSYSSYGRTQLTIGTEELTFNRFCTYSNEHKYGNAGTHHKRVYMKDDSLFVDYYVVNDITYNPNDLDTIYYSYQGVKK